MFGITERETWAPVGVLIIAVACVLAIGVLIAGGLVISAAAWVFSTLANLANGLFMGAEHETEVGELFLRGPSFWLVRFSWVLYAAAMAIAVANRLARHLGWWKRAPEGFSGLAEGLSVRAARAAVACSCAAVALPCARGVFIQQQDMADFVPVAVACVVASILIGRAIFWLSGVVAAGGSGALLHAFVLPLASSLLAMPLAVAGTFGGLVASLLIANLPMIIVLIIVVRFLPFFLAVIFRM